MKTNRYARQVIFPPIGPAGQESLRKSSVVLVGCGALGSVIANNLVRAGVGELTIIDRDIVELDNLQRQVLFDEEDARRSRPKSAAAKHRLGEINSGVKIKAVVGDLTAGDVEGLLAGADLVMDGTDNFETRALINEACVKASLPWIYGAAVGSLGMTMDIIPGETACFSCLLPRIPPPGTTETCETAGIVNSVPGLIASLQTAEAFKLLIGDPAWRRELIIVDLWNNSYRSVAVSRREDCPVCGKGEFRLLDRGISPGTSVLCGREMIEILPAVPMTSSLSQVRARLEKLGKVSANPFLIRFSARGRELVLFSDGRALIKGARDGDEARALYARWVGN
jgi:adenylyltransferase/sulfurtransferase